ncbi:MAG: helix-turn-helix domain-containing protein [Oscillospiraceae bacterium]|nr:helix-turn-helix domain-containing protein [Oscillospiraceae bacterium]
MFTDVFVHLMQSRNISSYKLTKDTGIDNGLISKWKNAKYVPSAEMLIKIADYFDVSVDYLLGRTDNPDSHKA